MISFPNCKINLGLQVLQKRDDGYHDLQTIFYPVPMCDVLEVTHAPNAQSHTSIESHGLPVPGDEKGNLILKAFDLLAKELEIKPVHFALLKNIPMGAGLGGGSSDGAAALLLINKFFGLNLSEQALLDYALKLGSDCPFFILNKPCLGEGRGEKLSPIQLSLNGYWIALIKPPIHVSTALAFKGLNLSKDIQRIGSVQTNIQKDILQWKDVLKNDFEESVFALHPELSTIKEVLYQKGAVYASMSGSGATVYGLFKSKPSLNNLFANYFYYECELN
jgi:4-diphosphocytidyl-2-C-methyl-D-erythritol kinase